MAAVQEATDEVNEKLGQAGKVLGDTLKFLGSVATTELGGKAVTADAWNEIFHVPFAKNVHVNYTYYVTTSGNDTITDFKYKQGDQLDIDSDLDLSVQQDGDHLLLLDDANSIHTTLRNTTLDQLLAAHPELA